MPQAMFNNTSGFHISGGTFSNVGRDQFNNSNNTTNHIRGSHNQYHTENHGSYNTTNNGVNYSQWEDEEDEDEWDSGEDEREHEVYPPRPRGMAPPNGRGRPRPYPSHHYPNDAFRPRMGYAATTDPYYYPRPAPQDARGYYPDYNMPHHDMPERMQQRNSAPYPDTPDWHQWQRPGSYYPEPYSQSPTPPPHQAQAPRRQATHNPFRKAPASRREDAGQQGSGTGDGPSQSEEGNEYAIPRNGNHQV